MPMVEIASLTKRFGSQVAVAGALLGLAALLRDEGLLAESRGVATPRSAGLASV